MVEKKLQSITFSITNLCNLSCIWCFQDSYSTVDEKNGIEELERKIEIIKRIGPHTRNITLTGGEPLTNPYIYEILEACLNYTEQVGITTNGLLLNDKMIDYLLKNKIGLVISLDGTEEIHDRIRGKGTFQKTFKNIMLCRDKGVTVALQMTVSKLNIENIKFLINLAKRLKVTLAIQRMIPSGRGSTFDHLQLSREELKSLATTLSESGYPYVRSKDALHRPETNNVVSLMKKYPDCIVGGCKVGMGYVYVEQDGSVFGCPFMQKSIGNVLYTDESIISVLNNSQMIKDIRSQSAYTGKCRNCTWWYACRGCRAHAAIVDNIMGDDPLCWIEV